MLPYFEAGFKFILQISDSCGDQSWAPSGLLAKMMLRQV